eukprot:TRINITY_DN4348_c0_g2_i1.p1 TRINITY_DN4348_c0_g2~~TRINITY_DN4348_c0_g2_i1.p1  ORF type:complete len:222 (-),score=102.03 TRINITY_DN4348_c0_g2_i1:387-1052(-)
MDQLDVYGMRYGPDSPVIDHALTELDAAVGHFLDKLEERGLLNTTDFVIVSESGMARIDSSRVIFIDDYVDLAGMRLIHDAPLMYITPHNDSDAQELVDVLATAHPNMSAYLKETTPLHWHYTDNVRITPVMAIAGPGWNVATRQLYNETPADFSGGVCGYDNGDVDMQAVFIADGPSFRVNFSSAPFANVHLYSLVCELLGLTPAPNNGSLAAVAQLLAQ